jgi:predicted dehydrogenase
MVSRRVEKDQIINAAITGGYKTQNFGNGGDFGGYHRDQANSVPGTRVRSIVPGSTMVDPKTGKKIPLTGKEALQRAKQVFIDYGHRDLKQLLKVDRKKDPRYQTHYGIVATPNNIHSDDIRGFITAGKGVVSEKPMTTKPEDADYILKTVIDNKLPFVTAYTYTNYPAVIMARELVTQGEIGKVESFDAKYIQGWLASTENDSSIWRTDPAIAGAGATGDILTHIYEILRFTTGSDITELKAKTSALKGRNIDDNVWVEAKLENGAPVTLHASQTTEGALNDISFTIKGTKGTIIWTMNNDNDKPNELILRVPGQEDKVFKVSNGNIEFPQSIRDQIPGPGRHHFGNTDAIRRMHQVMSNELRDKPNYHYSGVHSGVAGVKFVNKVLESANMNSGDFGETVSITPVGNPDLSTYGKA